MEIITDTGATIEVEDMYIEDWEDYETSIEQWENHAYKEWKK